MTAEAKPPVEELARRSAVENADAILTARAYQENRVSKFIDDTSAELLSEVYARGFAAGFAAAKET